MLTCHQYSPNAEQVLEGVNGGAQVEGGGLAGPPAEESDTVSVHSTVAEYLLCPAAEFMLCRGRVQVPEGIGPGGAEDEQGDSHSCRCKQWFV